MRDLDGLHDAGEFDMLVAPDPMGRWIATNALAE
jgi:hypothetical protein